MSVDRKYRPDINVRANSSSRLKPAISGFSDMFAASFGMLGLLAQIADSQWT
jgi:hypothetical protein